MALGWSISTLIPGVSDALRKLDGMKSEFLAIPANVRMALDKLARVRRLMNQNNSITVEANEAALRVENNLKRVQLEWDTAAQRFTMLDEARIRGDLTLSVDNVTTATQLVTSAGYVIKNAKTNIAAVDSLASKYLTPEQREQVGVQTVGFAGISLPLVAAILAGVLILRRR